MYIYICIYIYISQLWYIDLLQLLPHSSFSQGFKHGQVPSPNEVSPPVAPLRWQRNWQPDDAGNPSFQIESRTSNWKWIIKCSKSEPLQSFLWGYYISIVCVFAVSTDLRVSNLDHGREKISQEDFPDSFRPINTYNETKHGTRLYITNIWSANIFKLQY